MLVVIVGVDDGYATESLRRLVVVSSLLQGQLDITP
jgi:hypothetical protein